MEILDFQRFKLLLEAEEETQAEETQPEPVEPPAPEEVPAEPTDDTASAPTPTDTSSSGSASTPPASDPFSSATLPPDPNAPVETTPSSMIKFVMLDPDKDWHSEYDDGGGIKRFPEYEVDAADLAKWIDSNGLTGEKDQIMQAFQGKKSMSNEAYDKLKKALKGDSLGKERGDLDIEYDEKSIPSTTDLNVVFVKKAD